MDGLKQVCKLCGNIIRDENYKVIEDVIKSIFDIQLLKLMLDKYTQSVICTTCSSKLLAAVNFKSACLYTDNRIIRYVGFENPKLVDLKDIYANEKGSKQGSLMLDDREICRLCLQPMGSDHKTIQELSVEIIEIYIPEINFAISTNPVICLKCHDALCIHSTFIRNCLDVEKQRNMNATDVPPYIEIEEIRIKYENEEGDASLHSQSGLIDTEETNILCEVDLKETNAESTVVSCKIKECSSKTPSESSNQVKFTTTGLKDEDPLEVRMYKCVECDYKCLRKNRLKQHQLRHKNPSEARVFKCDECDYKSIQKRSLLIHQLRHKNPSEVQMFQCEECDYRSVQNCELKRHQLRHKDSSEVRMFNCGECDYKCIQRCDLKRHQLRHKDSTEVQMFHCDECDYRTIHKYYLKQHQLRHRDPSEVKMFNCDQCDYKSILKKNVLRHQLIHKDPSEVQMFQCDECDHKSTQKCDLKRHQLIHKDRSEVQMFKCEECDFKTIHKCYLKQHQVIHKDPSEVQTFKCDKCDFKSIRKGILKKHQLRHKDPSEVQMFKCDQCDYKSVHKGNLLKHTKIHRKC